MSGEVFGRRTTIVLAAACAFSLVTSILFMLFGPELSSPPSAAPDSYSRSAIGHRAFLDLLRGLGIPVVASRHRSADRARDASLLVVAEPDLEDGDATRGAMLSAMLARAPRVLLVLPKWSGKAGPATRGWIEEAEAKDARSVEEVLRHASPRLSVVHPKGALAPLLGSLGAEPALIEPQLLAPSRDLEPIASSAGGVLVGLLDREGTHVYVLSDPDVIETHGLAHGDNALFAARLVDLAREGHEEAVLVDETLHGHELEPSAWRELFRFPLALALVQVAIAAGVLLWAGMGRFGAPLPVPPAIEPGKRFLVESTADLLLRGGHSPHALERYLAATVQDVARGTHAPAGLSREATREWLARVADARGVHATLEDLEREVAGARAAGAKEPRRVVAAALSVHGWRREMIDGPVRDS